MGPSTLSWAHCGEPGRVELQRICSELTLRPTGAPSEAQDPTKWAPPAMRLTVRQDVQLM
jgi:hypothetical protein